MDRSNRALNIREPIVAGRFYPASKVACTDALTACLPSIDESQPLPDRLIGGVVPHAGWMCSGRVTGRVMAAIARRSRPNTIVMFGAVHRRSDPRPAMFAAGLWETPIGTVEADAELADKVLAESNDIDTNRRAHADEHSLEVQMPFVKHLFAGCKVLPIMVPPGRAAIPVGQAVARAIQAADCAAVIIGTTDLTHYGPSYGFQPQGPGKTGLNWAKDVNDQRMIDLLINMDTERIIPEAMQHCNACGSGAITATLSAVTALGAHQAVLLEHTTSREVLGDHCDDAVGYAGVVFGSDSVTKRSTLPNAYSPEC